MTYVIFVLVLGLGVVLLVRAFLRADPAALARGMVIGGIAAGLAIVGYLAYAGRLGPAVALGSAFLPVLLRARGFWRYLVEFFRPRSEPASEIVTDYLRMRLDHDSGTLSGTVLKGTFGGGSLSDLDIGQLRVLLAECRRDDAPSVRLMETYLDRIHPDWRDSSDRSGAANASGAHDGSEMPGSGTMNRAEALAILGLPEGASAAQIREAHRQLIVKLHPDQGGSTYLAAKINAAKDYLLGP
jgi:hypothetical protein